MPYPLTPTAISPIGDMDASNFSIGFHSGDGVTSYDIQVTTDSTFTAITHWNAAGLTTNLPASHGVLVPYGGTALTAGTAYYWRAKVWNPTGTSAWCIALAFSPDPDTVADAYAVWANVILSRMRDGIPVTALGTMFPEGSEVVDLLIGEYRDNLHVVDSGHGEPIDRFVEVVGQSWSVDRDTGWTVDAISQDMPG
jgi:hypothetical protein